MLAALQGIEPIPHSRRPPTIRRRDEQPSLDQIMQQRLAASLDLDLRETAIDKSLGDLRNLEAQDQDRERAAGQVETVVRQAAGKLESQTTDEALLQLQRMLEVMIPSRPRTRFCACSRTTPNADDDPMRDVVTILKTMPSDKQKKILAEFKTGAGRARSSPKCCGRCGWARPTPT